MPAKSQQEDLTAQVCAHFGECLRAWRIDHGLLLKRAAAGFGVTAATWRRWEKCERFPSPGKLRLLAEFIGVPICCFFYQDSGSCPHCPVNRRAKP